MVEIKLVTGQCSATELRALAVFLTTLADVKASNAKIIAPEDNPAAGVASPQEAFGAPPQTTALTNVVLNQRALERLVSAVDTPSPLLDPMAAFAGGSVAVPNGAPFTAGAIPSPTAQVAPPGTLIPAALVGGMLVPLPASAAPTAAGQVQPGTPAPGVEIDADGLPWDPRIHSSGAKRNKGDNKWTAKRGVMPQTVTAVTAELRAAMNVGNAVPPAQALSPGMAAHLGTGTPALPIPTPQVSPPTMPSGAASNGVITMAHLLPRVTSAIDRGQLTPDQTAAIASEVSGGQVTNVAMFVVAPQLIPVFWARLDQLGVA